MKIKMIDNYQGVGHYGKLLDEGIVISIFSKGDEIEVDAPLGQWLIESKKAVEIKPVVYNSQPVPPSPEPFEPELRHDDVIPPVRKPRSGKRSQ